MSALLQRAEAGEAAAPAEPIDIPEEWARREQRLAVIAQAKAELAARAQVRFEHEHAEYQRTLAAREAAAQARGKPPRGKAPAPPTPGPRAQDQVNLTDAESRLMPTSGGGFEHAYHAQASVEIDTFPIVAEHVTQHTNDQLDIAPAIEHLQALPASLGRVKVLLAETGDHRAANLERCDAAAIEPLMPASRQTHHPPLAERVAAEPVPPAKPTPVEAVAHRLRTRAGRALYAKRNATVETVFGIVKHVLGFRQFLLRGLQAVQGEWTLVCLGWNLKRLFALNP